MNIVHALAAFLNSPAGVTILAGVMGVILKWVITRKTISQEYGGTIIRSIKLAEKYIPDNTASPGLQRFDTALKMVVADIETNEERTVTTWEKHLLGEAINTQHAKLEADGNLSGWEVPQAIAQAAQPPKGGTTSEHVSLNSFIGWLACAGLLISMVTAGGCASQDATMEIYGKSLAISTALHESAIAYHTTAVAASVAPADRYAVEKRMDLVLSGVAAVIDSLQADAAAYEAAVAAGSTADAAAANSRAKLSLNALNALATRLAAEMASP